MDYNFYRNFYCDLIKLSNKELDKHYEEYGENEGRICNITDFKKKKMKLLLKFIKSNNFLDKYQFKNKKENFINILVRTANRPKFFEKCFKTIIKQNYTNYKIHISFEDDESLSYILNLCKNINNIAFVRVTKGLSDIEKPYFYNDYCNKLLDKVYDGYVIFLDDDDCFTHKNCLKLINDNLEEDKLLFWAYLRADRIVYPRLKKINIFKL